MVVLDGSGGIVTVGNNQYLQPDYLTPPSATVDTQKSPLALLAQTCSQIGADSSAIKPLLTLDKNKKDITSKSPQSVKSSSKLSASSPEIKLAFKPYESNVFNNNIKILSSSSSSSSSSISSSSGVQKLDNSDIMVQQHLSSTKNNNSVSEIYNSNNNNNNNSNQNIINDKSVVNRVPLSHNKSNSPEISVTSNGGNEQSNDGGSSGEMSPDENRKTKSPTRLETFQKSHAKDILCSNYGINPLSSSSSSSSSSVNSGVQGLEHTHHQNPAFHHPSYTGSSFANHHHHAAELMNAATSVSNEYSHHMSSNSFNSYISYQRIKTPSGNEAIIPVCKDPYCIGCPYSIHNHLLLGSAAAATNCSNGCTQCEHQKYGLPTSSMDAFFRSLPPGHPYASAQQQTRSSPYICSWTNSDSTCCGKKFNTPDELFIHLRMHTGNSELGTASGTTPSVMLPQAAAAAAAQTQSFLYSLFSPSALRGYSAPPTLTPMSAAAAAAAASRYHPYAKFGGMPLPSSIFATFNSSTAAALGSYYSPYSMFDQRIGSTVHP